MSDIQRRQAWKLWNERVTNQTLTTGGIIGFIAQHMQLSEGDIIELLLLRREVTENGGESSDLIHS